VVDLSIEVRSNPESGTPRRQTLISAERKSAFMTLQPAAHGGTLVAETLERLEVEFVFTLCGGHLSPAVAACRRRGLRLVDVRDEAAAVFAAEAVARLSGVPGAALVTAGPGLTNTIGARSSPFPQRRRAVRLRVERPAHGGGVGVLDALVALQTGHDIRHRSVTGQLQFKQSAQLGVGVPRKDGLSPAQVRPDEDLQPPQADLSLRLSAELHDDRTRCGHVRENSPSRSENRPSWRVSLALLKRQSRQRLA
jgi:hypothetical protein